MDIPIELASVEKASEVTVISAQMGLNVTYVEDFQQLFRELSGTGLSQSIVRTSDVDETGATNGLMDLSGSDRTPRGRETEIAELKANLASNIYSPAQAEIESYRRKLVDADRALQMGNTDSYSITEAFNREYDLMAQRLEDLRKQIEQKDGLLDQLKAELMLKIEDLSFVQLEQLMKRIASRHSRLITRMEDRELFTSEKADNAPIDFHGAEKVELLLDAIRDLGIDEDHDKYAAALVSEYRLKQNQTKEEL